MFTVTFTDWDDTVLKTQSVESGAAATAPANPTRDGYAFVGWDKDFSAVTSDLTVKAKYNARMLFCVTFLDWDLTILKEEYVLSGNGATAPTSPTREGYTFAGWNKTFNKITADTTVTATYDAITTTFTVTFLSAESTTLKTETVSYGGSATAPTPPLKEGYAFMKWSVSFSYVTSNITTVAVYRSSHYAISAQVFSGNTQVGEIDKVISCSITQKLNGECTMELTTLSSRCGFILARQKVELASLVFDIVGIKREIRDGLYLTTLICEHISYCLNDYVITEFSYTGTPAGCLSRLLSGTPLSVGTVDISTSVSLQINQECTKREAVMQLIALCDGEISYEGHFIGIKSHVGSTTRKSLMEEKNVTNVGVSIDTRQDVENYSVELYQRAALDVGDEIYIRFNPLSIYKNSRIISMTWNPFNWKSISIEVGSYQPTISDALYKAETKTAEATSTAETSMVAATEALEAAITAIESIPISTEGGGTVTVPIVSVATLPANPLADTIYLIKA